MPRDFTIVDVPQRSKGWFDARLGRVTGSKAACVLMGNETAGRCDYVLELALGRLTGNPPPEGFTSAEMQRGIDKEPFARMRAERDGRMIRETGFLRHDKLMIGTSLDGDENDFETLWDFKCPKSTTHLKYLESAGVVLAKDYQPQIMHALYVTGAERFCIGSFDDRMPVGLDWVEREVLRRDLPMQEYEAALLRFLADVDATVARLQQMQLRAMPRSERPVPDWKKQFMKA
jgi:hypothetical protein